MIRVGITGHSGFIGRHLSNSINLFPEEFERVNFENYFFENEKDLDQFVSSCDTIVHLAAKNRHDNAKILFDTNIDLVNKLIKSLTRTGSKAHIIFSSSTQENRDNQYGLSKMIGRNLFRDWAGQSGGIFTGMIIPNVFGPFGVPKYNSVVATFCYQLAHDETPRIEMDGELGLIYVGELVNIIIKEIRTRKANPDSQLQPTRKILVSSLLEILVRFKEEYQEKGIIPGLAGDFELNLFNSYRSYIPLRNYFPVKYIQNKDTRGEFVELVRLHEGGQISFSTTRPGITRGNHFHTRKIERFAVIRGKALIQMRRIDTDDILDFFLSGEEPGYVDMPIWYTHNIKNIGEDDLYTVFWINEFYNPSDPDTYFIGVSESSKK